ncbi:MAG: zinc-binding dehydrogenase [Candidatus Eisenbacteria bacterium]
MKALVEDHYGPPDVLELRDIDVSTMGPKAVFGFVMVPNQADLTILKDLIEAGDVRPVLDSVRPLGEVCEAIRYLEGKHAEGRSRSVCDDAKGVQIMRSLVRSLVALLWIALSLAASATCYAGSCSSPVELDVFKPYWVGVDTREESDSVSVVCGEFETKGPELVYRVKGPTGCFIVDVTWEGSPNAAIYLTVGDCASTCEAGATGNDFYWHYESGDPCYGPEVDYYIVVDSTTESGVTGSLHVVANFADPVLSSGWGEIKALHRSGAN